MIAIYNNEAKIEKKFMQMFIILLKNDTRKKLINYKEVDKL